MLPASTTSKTNWGFDPRSVPDCDIWFDAADLSTFALSGNVVKTWANKGSLVMNAIQDVGNCTTATTANGLNYVTCLSGTQLAFTCPIVNQTRSWFVVARCTAQLIYSGVTPQYWSPVGGIAGGGQDTMTFTRSSTVTYIGTVGPSGISNAVGSSNFPNPYNSLTQYTFINGLTSSGGNNVITTNGTASYTLSTNSTAGSYNVGVLKYLINTASYGTGLDICELIHYGQAVTTPVRIAIEGYLMWKWGINITPASINFVPTSIPGCLAWYDAFNFSANGSTPSLWKDKSGNGYDASGIRVDGATAYPTIGGIAPRNNLTFAGTSTLVTTLSLGSNQLHTLFVVGSGQTTTANTYDFLAVNGKPGSPTPAILRNGSSTSWAFAGSSGAPISITKNTILSCYWAPTNKRLMINGHSLISTTASTTLPTGSVLMIGASTVTAIPYKTSNNLLVGTISEIILYNGNLTTTQRNQIEVYLSIKWQVPLTNMSASGRTYAGASLFLPPLQRKFNPTDIPGCTLWYDMADASSYDLTGTTVTTLRDKTVTGATLTNIGTPIVGTINGLNALSLNGSSYMSSTSANRFGGVNGITWFFVANVGVTNPTYAVICGSSYSDISVQNVVYVNANTILPRFRISNGGTANSSGSVAITTNTPFIGYSSTSFLGANLFYFLGKNGLKNTSFATAAGGVQDTVASTILLGWDLFTADSKLTGQIGEVLCYTGQISTGEIKRIDGYLSDKWNLRGSMDSNHPTYYGTTNTEIINFSPTSIAGCKMWLDASDKSTVNNNSITIGGTVTSWGDKSGTGLTITVGGTPVWDYSLNKLPGITTTTGRFYGAFPTALTSFTNTTFIVTQLNSVPTTGYPCVSIGNTATSSTRYLHCLDLSTTVRSAGFFGGTNLPIASITSPGTGVPFLWTEIFTGSTALNVLYNSGTLTATGTPTPTAPGSNASNFGIGTDPGLANLTTNTWPGVISEVIIYDNVLSTADRIRVEKYLAKKWGLTQSILVANRYINPGTIPNSPRFLPTTFADISLWLDAADPDGDTLLPASGSTVRAWTDKSWSTRGSPSNSGAAPTFTYDGNYPAIQFASSSSQYLTFYASGVSGPTLSSPTGMYSIFIVSRYTGSTSAVKKATSFYDLRITTTGAQNYIAVYDYWNTGSGASTEVDLYYNTGTPAYNIGTTTGLGNNRIITNILETGGTNAIGYTDGIYFNFNLATITSAGSAANATADNGGYYLGATQLATNPISNFYDGYIYEVIIITHTPSTQEQRFIEGYLAWKWGLQGSLPASHPFSKVNP